MATNSRGRVSLRHGKEHDCLIDSKSHRTQALCCAVFDYLVHLNASGRKPTTIGSYGESLALLGRRLGESIPLRNISATLLNAAVAGLTAIDGRPRKRRSQTTLNRHRSAYRGFFGWAFETKRMTANPALLLGSSNMESVPTQPMTLHDVRSFLWAIRNSKESLRLRDESLFALYAFTGLRRAEALSLDVADYNASTRTLQVKNGKSGRPRVVHVQSRDVVLVSRALGHGDLRPTLRYIELSVGELPDWMETTFRQIA